MSGKKSILARLLSNENIEVRHGSYETAFFDIKNRILGLPLWNDDKVYDLLIGHEVGHALYTPFEGWNKALSENKKIPKSIYNVVEDVRIERLIQNKYPGLIACFNKGYKYMNEKDFFELNGVDYIRVKDFNFIDRLNLKAKLRELIDVEFTEYEESLFEKCKSTETWEDVEKVTEEIYEYMKNDILNIKFKVNVYGSSEEKSDGENGENESAPISEESIQSLESITDKKFEENKSKNLLSRDAFGNLEKISQGLNKQQRQESLIDYNKLKAFRSATRYVNNVTNTKKFIKENENVVANMVKEFEIRKSAHQYSKASISRSGTLDVDKLYQYKLTDDIFLRNVKLADSKNHGMVMLIDYSGSMSSILSKVIKQTLVLSMFCKKANIPFIVYGFTGDNYFEEYRDKIFYEHIDNRRNFVFELLSSNMDKIKYQEAFGILVDQSNKEKYQNIGYECLGNTPLNESLIIMYDVLRKFRSDTNVEKLVFVTLTDGCPSVMKFFDKEGFRITPNKIKIDGKYFDYERSNLSEKILNDMREKCIFDSCLNFNIVYRNFYRYKFKNGAGFKNNENGYDRIIVLKGDKNFFKIDDEELEIDVSSQSKIVKSFKDYSKTKKTSRVIATKFIEMVS